MLQLDDEAVELFVDQQKNKNTKRKTESDLKTWYTWCAKHGETRELEDIPPTELDRLLGHFFVTVRKKDGSLYEPDTLSSFHRSIDRHLTKDLHKPYSIIRDTQFAPSREKLKASRKFLKGKGKGNKPNAAEPVDVAEVKQLWQQGALRASDPVTLQQTVWWLISTQMGTRGRDEHHKFKFGDFQVKKASDGTEFIEFSHERGTKTRTGETEKSTNADARVFKPKMWATPDRPERCPVRIFQQYVDRRPPEMCEDNSPFYLSINHKHKPGSYWYKKLPLGIHKVDGMMKKLAKDGSLTGKKTNHSARKTQVQTLCAANVADSAVMQLSGHKSVQSLNHYKRPSLEQEKHMSHLLSNYCPSSSVKPSPLPAGQPSVNYVMSPHQTISESHLPLVNQAVQSRPPTVCQDEAHSPFVNEAVQSHPPVLSQVQLPAQATITSSSIQAPFQQAITKEQINFALSASTQGLFANGSFSNCTFEINLGQNQKRTKRPRVIYSDSDED